MAVKAGADLGPTPQANHNGNPETFYRAVRDIGAIDAQIAALNARRKDIRKGFKAQGIALKILDDTVRQADWSRDELREYEKTRSTYRHLMNLPGAAAIAQAYPNTPDHVIAEEEAFNAGKTAGLLGKPGQVPEELDASLVQHWLRGHAAADEAMFDEVEDGNEEEEDLRPPALKAKTEQKLEREAEKAPSAEELAAKLEEQIEGGADLEDQLETALDLADAEKVVPIGKAGKAAKAEKLH